VAKLLDDEHGPGRRCRRARLAHDALEELEALAAHRGCNVGDAKPNDSDMQPFLGQRRLVPRRDVGLVADDERVECALPHDQELVRDRRDGCHVPDEPEDHRRCEDQAPVDSARAALPVREGRQELVVDRLRLVLGRQAVPDVRAKEADGLARRRELDGRGARAAHRLGAVVQCERHALAVVQGGTGRRAELADKHVLLEFRRLEGVGKQRRVVSEKHARERVAADHGDADGRVGSEHRAERLQVHGKQ
jgi:hypothetical protein